MLKEVFRSLDEWAVRQNVEAAAEGLPVHRLCAIRVFSQMALWEAGIGLALAVTNDVDVYADYEWPLQKRFEQLLSARGKFLDPTGHEAWMPPETVYRTLYAGSYVVGAIAEPEYVLVSKALKAPAKNGPLLTEYLANGASPCFVDLAERYQVDLEPFL